MAFLILQNSTTADASDVNANFYHVAQGTRLPMGGDTLTSTDAAYDLGSSVATWNNLHCENININNSITTADKSLWTLIYDYTTSATIGSYVITGLNGDNDKEYKIMIYGEAFTSSIFYMEMNITITTSGVQELIAIGATITARRKTNENNWQFLSNTGAAADMGKYLLYLQFIAQTGVLRTGIASFMWGIASTTVNGIKEMSFVWNNTTDTITSLNFQQAINWFPVGTHFQLWKRG